MWSIASTSNDNTLQSGIGYGDAMPIGGVIDAPAKSLVAGQPYTVEVTRADPKGSGSGFFNTNNRYAGVATFTLPVVSATARPSAAGR